MSKASKAVARPPDGAELLFSEIASVEFKSGIVRFDLASGGYQQRFCLTLVTAHRLHECLKVALDEARGQAVRRLSTGGA